jgi:hypothetical protein
MSPSYQDMGMGGLPVTDLSGAIQLRYSRNRRKNFAAKTLTGALHIDAVRYCLSVGRGVKMEISLEIRKMAVL